ncbi:MAG: hypothetical protein PHQ40_18560 [Anaerolineaceae bacterium]|nr:hypothetical protein [Anaerolineaceae bacterium]
MGSQTKLIIGICALIPLVLIVNLALLSALRKRHRPDTQRMIIRARNSLQQPWREEDDQLLELAKRVEDLKKSAPKPPPDSP